VAVGVVLNIERGDVMTWERFEQFLIDGLLLIIIIALCVAAAMIIWPPKVM
jgi:hypothetical protein